MSSHEAPPSSHERKKDDAAPSLSESETNPNEHGSNGSTQGGNGNSAPARDGPPRPDERAAGGTSLNDVRQQPCNIEAEQALIGALIFDNETYFRISDVLKAEFFFDPLHQRIYHAVTELIRRGQLANPVTLKTYFENDAAMEQVGGTAYLAKLAGAAPTIINAPEYARTIFELHQRRGLVRIGEDLVNSAANPLVEDSPNDQIGAAEQMLYELADSGRYQSGFSSFAEASEIAVEMANKAYQRDGGLSGVGTGFIDLDRLLGGMHSSDLIILAGRPSMGKSSLATNIALNAALRYRENRKSDGSREVLDGAIVAFFSLEMSADQLAMRILSEQSRIPSHKLRKGDISEDEFRRFAEANTKLLNLPLHIDDTGGLSIAALAARARRLQRQKGLDLIVVDYLQLVTTSRSRRNDGRVQEVSEVTQGLKALAKDLNVPVLALAQLSRKVEDRDNKRPQLADLRESGAIEQDADVVMFIYREEYYLEQEQPGDSEPEKYAEWQNKMDQVHGGAEIIVGKQRHGPTRTIKLQYDAHITRFSNLAKQELPENVPF